MSFMINAARFGASISQVVKGGTRGVLKPIECGQKVIDSKGKIYWFAFEDKRTRLRYFSPYSKAHAEKCNISPDTAVSVVHLVNYSRAA